jgi:RsiW-degrading membrane proteinase PrsW (M82 family)
MLVVVSLSFVAAVIPTILYAIAFYLADRYEREPVRLTILAFAWGALPAAVVSLISEVVIGIPFQDPPWTALNPFFSAVIVGPIVEEIAKAIALLALYHWLSSEFDGVLDGVTYGALIGFGFAMTENFLYYAGAFGEGGLRLFGQLVVLRGIVFGLNHAVYTAMTGIGLGMARMKRGRFDRWRFGLLGLFGAMLIHAAHNFGALVSQATVAGTGISVMVAALGASSVIVVLKMARDRELVWIRDELVAEIGTLLSRGEYDLLVGLKRRSRAGLSAGPGSDRRLALCIELAFRKHRLRRLGVAREPSLPEQIRRLREEIARML